MANQIKRSGRALAEPPPGDSILQRLANDLGLAESLLAGGGGQFRIELFRQFAGKSSHLRIVLHLLTSAIPREDFAALLRHAGFPQSIIHGVPN
jgi:hypothetical protein